MELNKQEDVVSLMESSKNEDEWNANCDKVKEANNNTYPDFWYNAIILSGVATKTSERWDTRSIFAPRVIRYPYPHT